MRIEAWLFVGAFAGGLALLIGWLVRDSEHKRAPGSRHQFSPRDPGIWNKPDSRRLLTEALEEKGPADSADDSDPDAGEPRSKR
jgi:hypothetical protein